MSSLDERIAALSPEQRELLLQRMKNRGRSSPAHDVPRKHDDLLDDQAIQLEAARSPDSTTTAAATPDADVPAGHLIRVPGGAWMLWRSVVLRGAGFPADLVLNLAPSACRSAADLLIEAESQVQAAENQAAAAVNAALDALQQAEQWHDSARRDPLVKLLRAIRRRKVAQAVGYSPEMIEALDALRAALVQHVAAQTNYRLVFEQGVRDVSQAIYAVSRDHRFREAVIWQNRQAYHTGVCLLQPPGEKPRNSRQRQHEELIASYLQRYCVKNDTIGFFGPVGWAELRSTGAAITVQAGTKLVANRSVYFEGWCIDALGETLAQGEALLPWVAPRRMPFLHLEGNDLFLPLAPPTRLSPQQTALLRAIDGQRTARQLAQELIAESEAGLHTEQRVYDLLHELRAQRRIAWTLEVSAEDGYPEQHLRRLLERVEDEALRDSALHMLEELERSRDDVVRAAGDADALDRAQSQLEATFTRLTGGSPTRNAGQMYASRALIYEDCRRDAGVEFGPDFLATLGPPLTLLLTSARWFTYQVANAYRRVFERTYRTLAQKAGSPVVRFADFWLYVQPFILGDDTRITDSLQRVLRERWQALLAPQYDERRLTYSCEQLHAQVLAAFDAPHPGWQSARYHSPDLMIAAADAESIRRNDYQIVLGEFHMAMNTAKINLFLSQHPEPQAISQALEHDLPHPVIIPVVSKQWPAPPPRTLASLAAAKDFRLLFAHDACGVAPEQELPIGSLVIEETEYGLLVSTHDRRMRFDIVEVFGELLAFRVTDCLKLLEQRKHTPRISFDRLIVCRESWHFAPSEIAFVHESAEAERFIAARRWLNLHGIPRFVFMKSSVEEKPVYVDFDSPLLLDIFAKIVRRTAAQGGPEASVRITEMLPDPNHIWLPDHADQRYTSELRTVAVDPVLTPRRAL